MIDASRAKRLLGQTWLFPRYVHLKNMQCVLAEAAGGLSGAVLDVGCGRRQYERLFGNIDRYVGVDWPVSSDSAAPDVVADALHLPFGAAGFDVVLTTEVMEHVGDPDQFLREIRRVLRDGGSLILSIPFMEPLHEEPRDYFRFTPHSLRLLLERHGFRLDRLWKKGGWWSVVLGSFVSQSLYDAANPVRGDGTRSNGPLTAAILPICALVQMTAYALDRVFKSERFTLGYVVLATVR